MYTKMANINNMGKQMVYGNVKWEGSTKQHTNGTGKWASNGSKGLS